MAKENPETPPGVDPWAVLDRLTNALAAIAAQPKESQNEALITKLSNALERVSENQLKGAEIIAAETRRAHRPSNEVVPGVSVFNRRGNLLTDEMKNQEYNGVHCVKPPLKCPMFIPWIVEHECCTREEVELLNLLEQGEYTLSLIDRSKIKMAVKIDQKLDGKGPSRLLMHDIGPDGQVGTAFKNENHRLMVPLSDMLRQILKQHDPAVRKRAAAVLTDEEEEALIEAGAFAVSV